MTTITMKSINCTIRRVEVPLCLSEGVNCMFLGYRHMTDLLVRCLMRVVESSKLLLDVGG